MPGDAISRVQRFLDVCGTPGTPIVKVWQHDENGRLIAGTAVGLFAADVRALLDTARQADELLGLRGEDRS